MKSKGFFNSVFVISLIIVTNFITCNRQKTSWQGIIEEVNGITVVRNPSTPIYDEEVFFVEEDLSIGEIEGREEYMFASIAMIVVDDAENIYVADRKAMQIRIFSRNGEYLRTIGRKGQGPGEFNSILSISITPTNELLVQDRSAARWTLFSLDGDYLDTIPIKDSRIMGVRHINAEGNYIVEKTDFQRRGEKNSWHNAKEIAEYSSDMEFIKTIFKDKFRDAMSPPLIIRFNLSDLLICGFPENAYEIHILDLEGNVIRKIFKEHHPYRISEAGKESRGLAGAQDLPTNFPPFENISIDDEGRIFVQLYEQAEEGLGYLFDVFNTDGKYVTKVALKTVPQCWKPGKLYTIEEDENGFQLIKRYKITWKF